MKRTVMMLLCVLLTMSLIGCENTPEDEKKKKQTPVKKEVTVPDNTEIGQESELNEDKVESKKEEQENTENKNSSKETSGTVIEEKQTTTAEDNKQEEQTNSKPETTAPSTNQTQTTPQPTTPPTPSAPNATAGDTRAVANKVLEYINSYRGTPATKLPGLTSYAEYRSKQLVSNFAHSTEDERAAATALQYGTYVDPSLYGMTGTPYYESGAREAIAKGGYVGTVDEVASWLANLVKNSARHWAYVGSSEYQYIAVGVTYDSDMWYCDIAIAKVNTDNN